MPKKCRRNAENAENAEEIGGKLLSFICVCVGGSKKLLFLNF